MITFIYLIFFTPEVNHIQWRIQDFPEEGAPTPRGGTNIRFCQIFPKTAWNWKNLDPGGGGGARPKFYYVDLPLISVVATVTSTKSGLQNQLHV